MITNENTSIAFAIASGGYLLESNLGATSMYDSDGLSMYRASAAVAEYSRVVAAEMYGPHRPYGYTYGGSGGGFKTMAAAENTTGVWDGFVPYVIGSPVANAVRLHGAGACGAPVERQVARCRRCARCWRQRQHVRDPEHGRARRAAGSDPHGHAPAACGSPMSGWAMALLPC